MMVKEEAPEITSASSDEQLVVKETPDDQKVGEYIGQCKWFNDVYGYGFLTIQAGAEKGKDIFVHHSGICPLNSLYKTLKKGEYVNFNIIDGENGLQAVNVTGICGGSLMCDVLPSVRKYPNNAPPPPQQGFTPVHYGKSHYNNSGTSPSKMRRGGHPGGGAGGGRPRSAGMQRANTVPR